jgi:hypothetical protein
MLQQREEPTEPDCPICLCPVEAASHEDSSLSSASLSHLCSEPISRDHPCLHKECLIQSIDMQISQCFPGRCPNIVCPCGSGSHSDKKSRILKFRSWSALMPPTAVAKYVDTAKTLTAFLCGGCHNSRSLNVDHNAEIADKARRGLIDLLRKGTTSGTAPLAEEEIIAPLMRDLDAYSTGTLPVQELYTLLTTSYFPQLQTGEDRDAWEIVKLVLQCLDDPERRASLQIKHLTQRPRFWTPCCSREHCFRCKTKDFHEGKTCEQNMGGMDATIINCPKCFVALMKGDGCNSVECFCGFKFNWSEELASVKVSLFARISLKSKFHRKTNICMCDYYGHICLNLSVQTSSSSAFLSARLKRLLTCCSTSRIIQV